MFRRISEIFLYATVSIIVHGAPPCALAKGTASSFLMYRMRQKSWRFLKWNNVLRQSWKIYEQIDTFPCQLNSEQHCVRRLSVWKHRVAGNLVFKCQNPPGVSGAPCTPRQQADCRPVVLCKQNTRFIADRSGAFACLCLSICTFAWRLVLVRSMLS
jgi:hypothetical protein